MLPRAHRMRKEEVEEVFRRGKPFFVMELGIRYQKKNQKISKFAFVCGKKALRGAVERNRFKRLARESVWSLQKKWPKGYNIVVFAAKKPTQLSKEILEQSLERFFEKIL